MEYIRTYESNKQNLHIPIFVYGLFFISHYFNVNKNKMYFIHFLKGFDI